MPSTRNVRPAAGWLLVARSLVVTSLLAACCGVGIMAMVFPASLRAQSASGVALDANSREPVPGAEVLLRDASDTPIATARTDSSGRFTLVGIPEGTFVLAVRRIGYQPISIPNVTRTALSQLRLEVLLTPAVRRLADVAIEAVPADQLQRMIAHRQALGAGTILNRGDIDRRNPSGLVSLLQEILGASMRTSPSGAIDLNIGRGIQGRDCLPALFVNGSRIGGAMGSAQDRREDLGTILQMIPVEMVEAIEVYRGVSQQPAEYGGTNSACGVIAVWIGDR